MKRNRVIPEIPKRNRVILNEGYTKTTFLKEIIYLLKSPDGLLNMLGILILCWLVPILLLIGLIIYKIIEYLI